MVRDVMDPLHLHMLTASTLLPSTIDPTHHPARLRERSSGLGYVYGRYDFRCCDALDRFAVRYCRRMTTETVEIVFEYIASIEDITDRKDSWQTSTPHNHQ